jgi:RNA polymerase sigma-70 factor (ECF subfamily)
MKLMKEKTSDSNKPTDIVKPDNETISRIYKKYYELLFAYAYKNMRSELLAKDVVQDVFEKILKNGIPGYSSDTPIKRYLFQAVRNKIIDVSKKDKNVLKYLESQLDKSQETHLSADSKINFDEVIDIIQAEVARLTVRKAEIFRLCMEENMPHGEIAARLGISQETVRKTNSVATKLVGKAVAERIKWSILYFIFINMK